MSDGDTWKENVMLWISYLVGILSVVVTECSALEQILILSFKLWNEDQKTVDIFAAAAGESHKSLENTSYEFRTNQVDTYNFSSQGNLPRGLLDTF